MRFSLHSSSLETRISVDILVLQVSHTHTHTHTHTHIVLQLLCFSAHRRLAHFPF